MNTLIFIGPLRLGTVTAAGDSMKNQIMYDSFVKAFDKVLTVDTIDWRRRPWVLFYMLVVIMFHRCAKVIVSTNTDSAYKIIRLIGKLHFPNDCYYSAIGGVFADRLRDGEFPLSTYRFLKGIFVEGKSMVETLRSLGLTNVEYVPTTKKIEHYGNKQHKTDNITHFVFFSRLEESKGCTDIMKSIDALNDAGYKNKYDVVFYGKESEDAEYAKAFMSMVDAHDEVKYKGLLNLRDSKSYDELAKYDVMLFPTYWYGEGLAGMIIDSYIASLPIIASDWGLNRELIEDGVTGWIIPAHDVAALAEQMKYTIEHTDEVRRLSGNCRVYAAQYDTTVVFSKDNLKKLGLL